MAHQVGIRYPDFETLVKINKRVVSLRKEKHDYTGDDERQLRRLLHQVEGVANNEEMNESMIRKVSLLAYGLANGQHFHEGNKRTALVAAHSFLRMNGFRVDLSDRALLSVLDEASVGKASLSKVTEIIKALIRNV